MAQLTISVAPPPQAFVCSHSRRVMENPVLSLCGHLFDQSVFKKGDVECPIDKEIFAGASCIALPELKKAINTWKNIKSVKLETTAERLTRHPRTPASSPRKKATPAAETMAERLSRLSMGEKPRTERKTAFKQVSPLIKKVSKAHADDIHGFIKTADGFISGSKDGSLKMWSAEGRPVLTIGGGSDYRYWVTALESFPDGRWACGSRDGGLYFFSKKGEVIDELYYKTGKAREGISKRRNINRINCVSHFPFSNIGNATFFTGTPKFWQVWDLEKRSVLKQYKAHDNDWVYCIDPLSDKTALVVVGASLELWSDAYPFDSVDREVTTELLIKERPSHHRQRPHISSICRLQENKNNLAAALFNGSIKLLDVEKRTEIRTYREHRGRVWKVINVANHLIGSGADDALLKIWDVRQPKSVMTFGNHPGRVSALLQLKNFQIISGSCADNPHASREKAIINFWDLRKTFIPHDQSA